MKSDNYVIEEVVAIEATPAEAATSTSHNIDVAWPYVVFSIALALSLIGVAHRLLRNQTD